MKKVCGWILALMIFFGTTYIEADAAVIGEVITTDIVAFIDEQPIDSYNINDYTYVIAEDLEGYGFITKWDASQRTLRIYRSDLIRNFAAKETINILKEDIIPGRHAFDVFETDIKTFFGTEESPVNAYNVDGRTLIQIDELARYGYFSYNEERREVKINLSKFDTDWLYSLSSKTEISLPCAVEEGQITYSGDVKDGKPEGFGTVTEEYKYTNGLNYDETYIYTTKFVENKPYGLFYGYRKVVPYNGSDRRVREEIKIENYIDGVLHGNLTYIELHDGNPDYRIEEKYNEGKLKYKRLIEYDDKYRYGYKVVSEGKVDAFGNIETYEKVNESIEVSSVYAYSDNAFIIDSNGTLYSTGNTIYGKIPVPVKIDENAIYVSNGGNHSGAVIDKESNMYYLYDKIIKYKNIDVPLAAENVKSASSDFYLTKDGKLYIRPIDFDWTRYDEPILLDDNVVDFSASGKSILYKKDDNSVYSARINRNDGSAWIDGLDLSEPVKVFENADFINCKNHKLVIDNNGTLWGWSSYYYMTEYEGKSEDIFTTSKPIKIAENVKYAESGTGIIAYIKMDGSLYVIHDIIEPNSERIISSDEPVLICDDVKSMSCGGSYLMYVTNQGTLHSWGKNVDGRLGTGDTEHVLNDAEFIFDFYQMK